MKPLCVVPWTTLIINGSNYNCCCFYSMPNEGLEFPSSREMVMRIFNSASFKELRQRLLDGNIKGTGCELCLKRRGQHLAEIRKSDDEREVVKKARACIERGDVEVDYTPFSISLNTSPECNLRCVMCYNSDLPEQRIKASLAPYKKFISAISDIGFENINSITAVGGEPFMTDDALEIFKYVAEHSSGQTAVSVNTNGTLLHNHWDLIKKFDRLQLEFSIDAYEENYETIRRRASWARMIKNFKTFSELVDERPGFSIGINAVVMKTSLPDMAKVLKLGAEHNAKVRFSAIMGDYFDENIFQFPELLNGLPWEQYFEEAIAEAEKSDPGALEMLLQIRDSIIKQADKSSIRFVEGGCLDVFLHQADFLDSLPRKRVALLGTSAELMGLLTHIDGQENKEFVIMDFGFEDASRSYLGHPIVMPDELGEHADVAVISAKSYKYAKYKEWMEKNYPDMEVKPLPTWAKISYERAAETARALQGKPVVLFATGGTADILLDSTDLGRLDYVACSDNNENKWGGEYRGLPIVEPSRILNYAKDVFVSSDYYSKAIRESLEDLHGDAVNVHTIF